MESWFEHFDNLPEYNPALISPGWVTFNEDSITSDSHNHLDSQRTSKEMADDPVTPILTSQKPNPWAENKTSSDNNCWNACCSKSTSNLFEDSGYRRNNLYSGSTYQNPWQSHQQQNIWTEMNHYQGIEALHHLSVLQIQEQLLKPSDLLNPREQYLQDLEFGKMYDHQSSYSEPSGYQGGGYSNYSSPLIVGSDESVAQRLICRGWGNCF